MGKRKKSQRNVQQSLRKPIFHILKKTKHNPLAIFFSFTELSFPGYWYIQCFISLFLFCFVLFCFWRFRFHLRTVCVWNVLYLKLGRAKLKSDEFIQLNCLLYYYISIFYAISVLFFLIKNYYNYFSIFMYLSLHIYRRNY